MLKVRRLIALKSSISDIAAQRHIPVWNIMLLGLVSIHYTLNFAMTY